MLRELKKESSEEEIIKKVNELIRTVKKISREYIKKIKNLEAENNYLKGRPYE